MYPRSHGRGPSRGERRFGCRRRSDEGVIAETNIDSGVQLTIEYMRLNVSLMGAGCLMALFALTAQAQWLNFPAPGTPMKNGKPNLSAPTPKTHEGKPDLTGTWLHDTTTVEEVRKIFGTKFDSDIAGSIPGMEIGTQHKYGFDVLVDFNPPESAMTPAGLARYKKFASERAPESPCDEVGGFPFYAHLSEPIKIIQAPKETVVMYEVDNTHRQIFTDGRKLPKEFEFPAYQGYSVGHWEGNTLVVESAEIGRAHV